MIFQLFFFFKLFSCPSSFSKDFTVGFSARTSAFSIQHYATCVLCHTAILKSTCFIQLLTIYIVTPTIYNYTLYSFRQQLYYESKNWILLTHRKKISARKRDRFTYILTVVVSLAGTTKQLSPQKVAIILQKG